MNRKQRRARNRPRKRAWNAIKQAAPDVAALMAEVRRVFGQRAGVGAVVELGGERVWPVGAGDGGE